VLLIAVAFAFAAGVGVGILGYCLWLAWAFATSR
jgi:hypothetical protein